MLDLILKNGLVCEPGKQHPKHPECGHPKRPYRMPYERSFPAAAEIDCAGHIVSPGFVDAHSHEDDLRAGHIEADITLRALRQGVTTLVAGNCGDAPRDLPAYCAAYDGKQPVNMALLAGHTTIRRLCGARNKYAPVDEATLAAMCETLERQLTEGAKGLSMGIRYEPGMTLGEMCAMAGRL